MVPPNSLGLTARPLFYPPLELILAEAPDAADFEAGEFSFLRQTSDGERVNSKDLGDFVGVLVSIFFMW